MATATQNDFAVTTAWQDIAATIGAVASTDTLLQCISPDTVSVVFGGASAPTGKTGIVLRQGESYQGNAANIWVRCTGSPDATLSVTTS